MTAFKDKDIGVLYVLLKRFETQRLPHAQHLKAKVDRGNVLNEMDMAFLKKVREDTRHISALAQRHPEYQSIVAQAAALYKEITDKGLANQRAANPNKR